MDECTEQRELRGWKEMSDDGSDKGREKVKRKERTRKKKQKKRKNKKKRGPNKYSKVDSQKERGKLLHRNTTTIHHSPFSLGIDDCLAILTNWIPLFSLLLLYQ
jgi:hypothetical protein